MTPQNVTTRYTSSLISNGQNQDFRIDSITCHAWCQEEVVCGYFYKCGVVRVNSHADPVVGIGATPHIALHNALTKLGVTFRG